MAAPTREDICRSAAPLLRQMILDRRARHAAAKSVPGAVDTPPARATAPGRNRKDAAA